MFFAGMRAARRCAMASTDRAFRALARAEPDVVLAVLRAALPEFMAGITLDAEAVEDPKLDLPPPVEADLVARAGSDELLRSDGPQAEQRFMTHSRQSTLALTGPPKSPSLRLGPAFGLLHSLHAEPALLSCVLHSTAHY